ncbi:ubiquitin-conjugating enzyme/RWD-like protein [Diplogelasinospora grovesii]|uniref:Ubiquitin-conjugating enzyme/RWD-like protein n=1 Tax=Diplogelasinospora grovesii TaxID=303347 RepID=A0AAN6NDH0_9PEZI|nr:ubiquitin-conjugating enzyme/RWD-like protein [Diplogelasinospora grovesii]
MSYNQITRRNTRLPPPPPPRSRTPTRTPSPFRPSSSLSAVDTVLRPISKAVVDRYLKTEQAQLAAFFYTFSSVCVASTWLFDSDTYELDAAYGETTTTTTERQRGQEQEREQGQGLQEREAEGEGEGEGGSTSSTMSRGGGAATRRLLKELESWEKSTQQQQTQTENEGIERLGPVDDGELGVWEAVINGRGIGCGYDDGRWLLRIEVPANYPIAPPKISFLTPVVHANVSLQTGEICLDLFKDAWTPAYTLAECVRAVRSLLAHPAVDSPLNVDIANLLRDGDHLAARRLVELWVQDEKYTGQ